MALDAPITSQEQGLCPCHFIWMPSKVTRPRILSENDRPSATQVSMKAGCHQNHTQKARLGHYPLFSWAGGGRKHVLAYAAPAIRLVELKFE
jgi:hypothetical protein